MAEFTVAIELGSSKITGVAGKKNMDGSISILAVAQEYSHSCIRNGVVRNIDKTSQALTSIIKKLENSLKTRIAHVYVGVGGQSIQCVKNTNVKELPSDSKVTKAMIDELMDANRSMQYPGKQILDAITQEYKVDNSYQIDAVGMPCTRLEGNFLNILGRETFYNYLKKSFDQANITVLDMYLSPLALADSVLTETEKRSGCVLVDLGADTTTVCVYYKNIVRHLVVIPLGSNNITKDIASTQMEESDAEKIKVKYASAYTEANEIDKNKVYTTENGQGITQSQLADIVEARLEEIVENVWCQVPNELADKLLGGVILTGGGSNMKNIERAFTNHARSFSNNSHIEKVRVAKFVNETIKSTNAIVNAKDGRLCTVLGILAKGDQNCAGNEISNDLFGETEKKPKTTEAKGPKPDDNSGRIIQPNPADKAKEEQLRKQKEEEERRKQEEAEEAERKKKRENSWLHKIAHNLKVFGNKMVSPDEEE